MGAVVAGAAALAPTGAGAAAPPRSHTLISGRVTDNAGHPLSGVLVAASSAVSFVGGHWTRTGADGRYTLPTSPGAQQLQFSGAHASGGGSDGTGYFGYRRNVVVTHYGRTSANINATLRPAGAVAGLVTDAAGHALTSVRAYLNQIAAYVYQGFGDGTWPVPEASTPMSRNGHFTITGVPPGAYQLCLDTGQGDVTGGSDDQRGYAAECGHRVVVVGPGQTAVAAPAALATSEGSVISGRVVGPDNRPVANVAVAVSSGVNGYFYGYTGRDGTYRTGGLSARSYRICFNTFFLVTNTPTGYAPACRQGRLSVDGQRIYHVDQVLPRGAAIAGHVRGSRGEPLAGVPVFGHWGQVYGGEATAETTDAGRYVVKNLPGTSVDVWFSSDFSAAAGPGNATGGMPYSLTRRTTLGKISTAPDVRLAAAGGISGVVRGRDGRPMPNVAVDLEGDAQYGNQGEFYAYTDRFGRYTAVDLPPGSYQVCFSNVTFWEKCYRNTDYLHATNVDVKAGHITPNINGTLQSKHNSLTVVAEDAQGHRLAGVTAALFRGCDAGNPECLQQPLAGGRRLIAYSGVTGFAGRMRVQAVPRGVYQLCMYGYYGGTLSGTPSTGYQDTCWNSSPTISVDGTTNRTIVVRLPDAGAVSGHVTDANGNPLRNVRVHISGSAADNFVDSDYFDTPTPHWDAYTDSNGNFTIRSVSGGTQTVCFDPQFVTVPSGSKYQPQCLNAAPGTTSGGDPITVVADTTVSGVDIALTPEPPAAGMASATDSPYATCARPPARPATRPGELRPQVSQPYLGSARRACVGEFGPLE
jgi:hypothetical protein